MPVCTLGMWVCSDSKNLLPSEATIFPAWDHPIRVARRGAIKLPRRVRSASVQQVEEEDHSSAMEEQPAANSMPGELTDEGHGVVVQELADRGWQRVEQQ